MLGDSQTGKTSLVLRFVEGSYRNDRPPTVGAFFITKRLQAQGITCKLQIWDTAGQPQFRPLAKMYYDHAAAAILCFDVQSHSSWQVTKFWLEELHRNVPAGSIVLCLCACKTDSMTPHVVSTSEAKELAAANGAMFVETSAKQDHNVQLVFSRVAERVLHFQRKNRETGINKIPVTPGAAIGGNGQVVKPKNNRNSSVNRYGVVLPKDDGITDREERNEPIQARTTPASTLSPTEIPLHADGDSTHSQRSKRRDKRTRSVPVDDEVIAQPGMCGVVPGAYSDACVIQ